MLIVATLASQLAHAAVNVVAVLVIQSDRVLD